MKLYNYDYEDMMNLTFSLDDKTSLQITSKVYPTKLEVKIDDEKNIPYLYYEGIVQTNKGVMKIKFPRLDLVLDGLQNVAKIKDKIYYPFIKNCSEVKQYKMTTEFSNINEATVMFELERLDLDDCKSIREHFDME